MKRNRFYCALAAAAMVLPLSCSKDIAEATEAGSSPAQAYEGVSVDFHTAFTKTSLGEVEGGSAQVLWEAGDKIKVMGYYTEDETEKQFSVEATASAAGASAVFTAVVPVNATDIYAVYPSDACTALSKDADGNVSIPVVINQNSRGTAFKDAHYCVAKTTLAEKTLLFKNVSSIICFEIEDAKNFTSLGCLQYMALDIAPVYGTLPVSFASNGNLSFGTPTGTDRAANMGESKLSAGKHYFSVLPANYASGFAINCNYFDDPAVLYKKAADLSSPTILDIGKIDGKLQKDFYVTVAGAGQKNGKDWANAMGRNEFVSALATKTGESATLALEKYLQIWIYKGTAFHLGAGTYILGDEATGGLEVGFAGANGSNFCPISILGGYPEAGGDTRDISANVTKFSGDGKYHILSVRDRARLDIDGITFCNAFFSGECSDTATRMGAALFLSDSFKNTNTDTNRDNYKKGAARVYLTDCIFENNRNESSNTGTYFGGGSAIAIQKGYLHANRCTFRNNYDKGYIGCITTCGNYEYENLPSELFFNACLFEGNVTGTSKNSTGHVIHHEAKGFLLGIYNCTFHANNTAAEDNVVHNSNVINIKRSSIIANTTIYQSTYDPKLAWTGYPIRINGSVKGLNRHIFANNIFQSVPDSNGEGDYRSFSLVNAYTAAQDGRVYLKGNNVMSTILGKKTESDGMYKTDADETLLGSKNLQMTWNGSLGVFEWNSGETRYTNMTLEKMKEILKSSDLDNADATTSSFTWGKTFYNWLVDIDAVDKDATGATRPANGWLAGSYQQN